MIGCLRSFGRITISFVWCLHFSLGLWFSAQYDHKCHFSMLIFIPNSFLAILTSCILWLFIDFNIISPSLCVFWFNKYLSLSYLCFLLLAWVRCRMLELNIFCHKHPHICFMPYWLRGDTSAWAFVILYACQGETEGLEGSGNWVMMISFLFFAFVHMFCTDF